MHPEAMDMFEVRLAEFEEFYAKGQLAAAQHAAATAVPKCRVQGAGCRVQGAGGRGQGVGCRV